MERYGNDLKSVDIELGETSLLRVTLKMTAEHGEMIDIRKWVKWQPLNEFRPTKRGVLIKKDAFLKMLSIGKDILLSAESQNA